MVADALVVEPVGERGFDVDDFADLAGKALALFVYDDAVYRHVFTVDEVILVTQVIVILLKFPTASRRRFIIPVLFLV